jgi:hypothetical protein
MAVTEDIATSDKTAVSLAISPRRLSNKPSLLDVSLNRREAIVAKTPVFGNRTFHGALPVILR